MAIEQRQVELRVPDEEHPGEYYQMTLLQPLGWIQRNGAEEGAWVYLSLPELEIAGQAEVLAIAPCPPIEGGYGKLVLGTFTHLSRDLVEVKLAGADDPLRVTPGHLLWSLDRGGWVSAGSLETGELLAGEAGAVAVEYVHNVPGEVRTYNLSVEGDHRYLVGELGVVAHNAGPCPKRAPNLPQWANEGLDDLARFRQELGPIPGGGQANGGVIARLDVNGRSFYGVNAHGQHVTLRVNAVSASHAELDAFQQAANGGATGTTGRLFVDTPLCDPCGLYGGVKSLARQIGLQSLEIITPNGVVPVSL